MFVRWFLFAALTLLVGAGPLTAQPEIGASRVIPNLVGNIDRPLRYRPDAGDFVVENGGEFFNRPLYGGNTAFRVDGGDKPEFVLYLPGRGGNLRLGVRTPAGQKWLHEAASIEARYRPGELIYEVRDPVLGRDGVIHLSAIAYAATEGLGVKAEAENLPAGTELVWAYGGANGQRGKRDGDIGTESVPISQWFQLQAEFCRGNSFALTATGFTLHAKPATIVGVMPAGANLAIGDATYWNDLAALVAAAHNRGLTPALPILVGSVVLTDRTPVFLSLQRVAASGERGGGNPATPDLDIYREVTAPRPGQRGMAAAAPEQLAAPYMPAELPARFADAERHFAGLRTRVAVDTPDAYLNAAVGALDVAADAVWDGPQQGIMHGAIAWRTRLLGWRGPYVLDALGWHDRFRKNAEYWFARQNTGPIPDHVPPPEEKSNLARNEAGLHTNGDMSNSHYDMNLVFIDAVFRHLQWTGDLEFAREAWPVIQRHLAWERRLFRREYGPDKLPLYEAYAAIWASDDLQYSGGGAMHATAYNYYENRQAARLARLLGQDPGPYEREANLLAKSMRQLLWVTHEAGSGGIQEMGRGGRIPPAVEAGGEDPALQPPPAPFGWFAEYKDWLGLQRVHPDAALWTFYHTVDSEVPTAQEAWQMTEAVDAHIPHLPVRGPGVPPGLYTLATSDWMPYDWSINNVVMAEAVNGALAFWEAGRPDEAWAITKGSVLAAMFMGISPGNVGSMSYLDVYRRESQRDFADGAGVLSRAIVEGLFGIKPDALAGELRVAPGWPGAWDHARIQHPDFSLAFRRDGGTDHYEIVEHVATTPGNGGFPRPLALRLRLIARQEQVAALTVNGVAARWAVVEDSVGMPRIEVLSPAAGRYNVAIRWAGARVDDPNRGGASGWFEQRHQGQMRWWSPVAPASAPAEPARGGGQVADRVTAGFDYAAVELRNAKFDPVDLTAVLNDRVTQIFRNEYRSPRSPFVSLALPKQGIGGWAGGVNRTASIDDTGLRSAAAQHKGRLVLPNGVPFATATGAGAKNVAFTSQWDNYPHAVTVPVTGHARGIYLLMTGSTGPMQSRFGNGDVVVAYADGTSVRLPLVNPTNWWPIEQDYFIDDFQFRRPGTLPLRVDLKTGRVRDLQASNFEGRGGAVSGGAATVLVLPLDASKSLLSLTVQTTAIDVVIGLMAATLVR